MKAASHELKGVVNIYHRAQEMGVKVCLPLLALVDYRGYRLLASSILPIGKDTLVLGSSDAGASFHKEDLELFESVCHIGTGMNLREHGE